jgi:tripartite ATP-independent transporter DctP family solute receptor
MKMRKVLLVGIMCLLGFGMAGCAKKTEQATNATSDANAKPVAVVIKFANSQTPEEPVSVEIEAFAERVNKRSNGSLEIQVFHNGVLGDDDQAIEMCVRGANIMTYNDPAKLSYFVPDYSIMNGPYLFNDPAEIAVLAYSEWGQEMADACAKAGIKVLENCASYFGTRHTITKKPFTNPQTLRGMKFRVPATPMWTETITAMGGNPTSIPFSEVYSALSQGVADCMENPLPAIFAGRFHEVCKYVALTGHFIAPGGLEMSNDVFEGLTKEQQTILVEEAKEFARLSTKAVLEAEKNIQTTMEAEGVTFVDVDIEVFRNATEVVYTKFPEWSPGLYDRVAKILQDYRKSK